ncbi:MAG: hypothetical protein ACR2OJ_09995 [Hyphomicrobiales bacterium]
MANQKGKSRRPSAAGAPVIDAEAKEIKDDAPKSAKGGASTGAKTQKPSTDADKGASSKSPGAAKSSSESKSKAQSGGPAKTTGKPDTKQPTGGGKPAKKRSGVMGKLVGYGVLALAIAAGGAWAYREYGAQYFPSKQAAQQAQEIANLIERLGILEGGAEQANALKSELATLKKQVEQATANTSSADLTPALNAAKTAQAKAEEALTQAQGATKQINTLQSEIASVKAAIDKAAAAVPADGGETGEALKAAQMQISSLSLKVDEALKKLSDQPSVPDTSGEVAKLSGAVTALQASVKSISAAQDEMSAITQKAAIAGEEATALAAALTGLRQKLGAGEPFAAELEPLSQALPNDDALKTLLPLAKAGVAPTSTLISEFAAVAKTLAASSAAIAPADKKEGILARIQNRIGSLVKVRDSGSTDWAGLAGRMSADAARGDLAAMVRHMDGVSATPPEALSKWLGTARKRLTADQALNQLAADVMARAAATGKTGG